MIWLPQAASRSCGRAKMSDHWPAPPRRSFSGKGDDSSSRRQRADHGRRADDGVGVDGFRDRQVIFSAFDDVEVRACLGVPLAVSRLAAVAIAGSSTTSRRNLTPASGSGVEAAPGRAFAPSHPTKANARQTRAARWSLAARYVFLASAWHSLRGWGEKVRGFSRNWGSASIRTPEKRAFPGHNRASGQETHAKARSARGKKK